MIMRVDSTHISWTGLSVYNIHNIYNIFNVNIGNLRSWRMSSRWSTAFIGKATKNLRKGKGPLEFLLSVFTIKFTYFKYKEVPRPCWLFPRIQLHAVQATQRDPKEHIRPGANPFLVRRPEDFLQTNVLPSVYDYASSVLCSAES